MAKPHDGYRLKCKVFMSILDYNPRSHALITSCLVCKGKKISAVRMCF